jgi:hypothetical protein
VYKCRKAFSKRGLTVITIGVRINARAIPTAVSFLQIRLAYQILTCIFAAEEFGKPLKQALIVVLNKKSGAILAIS